MTETTDLNDIISFDGFSFADYLNGEQTILKPRLEEKGYTNIRFSTAEGDSFGPLIRAVNTDQGRLYYG